MNWISKLMAICVPAALMLLSVDVVTAANAFAASNDYPNKPIRFIVPFPAGAATDSLARLVARQLSEQLGQQVIADNRTGASGRIGTQIAANAEPDGYTLVMAASNHAINAGLYKNLPYNTMKDFSPISLVAKGPLLLLVSPSLPVGSVKALITFIKRKPGPVNFASGGIGSAPHVAGELFKMMAGVEMVHVPYNGGAPAIIGVIGGEASVLLQDPMTSLSFVRAGKLKALAVASENRLPTMNDLPTVSEAGLPGYVASNWWGLLAPSKTSKQIINKLHAELARALRIPEVKGMIVAQGLEVIGNTPQEFSVFIKAEIDKWGAVIRKSGATP